MNSADLHVDGYAINVAPKTGKVCVALPEGRDDADCAGLDLAALRTRSPSALAIVRHGDASYELAIDRVVQKDIGTSSAEALKQRGNYELVSIAGNPAARFSRETAVVYEVPSDDRALNFTFTGTAPEMRAEADAMVKSIVRPRADLTLYGKPAAEQVAFRQQYATAFERTQLAVRVVSVLAVVFVVALVVRVVRKRKR